MLDTNAASHVIKGTFPKIRAKLSVVPMASVCISTVTEAELLFGAARKANSPRLGVAVREFLLRVETLAWDSAAAAAYAELRARLERGGKPLGAMDMMIAAHAIACDVTLVTTDRAFREIGTLTVVDWTQS